MLKRLLLVAAVLMLLILLGVLALLRGKPSARSAAFTMASGNTYIFRGVTFGTNHVEPREFRLRDVLPRVLSRLGRKPGHWTESPSAMLWFEQVSASRNTEAYKLVGSVVLESGLEVPFGNVRFYGNALSTNQLLGLPVDPPLRERNLRVKLYDRSDYNRPRVVGELELRNELFTSKPAAGGKPLPQASSEGDLTVTLVSMESGFRKRRGELNPLDAQTRAEFRIEQGGALTRDWGPNTILATNQLGGVIRSRSWSSSGNADRPALDFQPVLFPGEFYDFRVEMSRKANAPFSSNEVWTVRGIAVPTNGGFTLVDTQWMTGPFTVKLHGLNTEKSNPPWNNRFGSGVSVSLQVSPDPESQNYRLHLIHITDESGKPVDTSGSGFGSGEFSYGIRPAAGTKTVDVTFALHRSRYVNFQVVPGFAKDGLKN